MADAPDQGENDALLAANARTYYGMPETAADDPAPDQGERDGLAERSGTSSPATMKVRPADLPSRLMCMADEEHLDISDRAALREAASRLRTSTEGPGETSSAPFSLRIRELVCRNCGGGLTNHDPEEPDACRRYDPIPEDEYQPTPDESSTEGGARPGDTPLNDTRTNSDRPWREDVARAFVTNRPAQPEGAGEARVNVDDLAQLEDGWDGYGKGRKITDAALATARHTQIVPTADGGLQMEWHIVGIDCEIEIQPDGKITSFYVEPALPDTPTEEKDA